MDSTRATYIDPSVLQPNPAAFSDDIPSLTVKPVFPTDIPETTTNSNNPFSTTHSSIVDPPTTSSGSPSVTSPSTTAPKSGTTPPTTGLRQRVNHLGSTLDHAAEHPAVQNAKGAAQGQVARLREILGRSQTVRDLEKRTNVDRVILVVAGAFLYLLLIPLNIFGLALPTTTFLTLFPPSIMALDALESTQSEGLDDNVKSLLSYFVALGFVQFLESLAAGVLEKRIPQYYTLKLLLLAYLLHPKTRGATQLHNLVLKPALQAVQTPSSSTSTKTSPGSTTQPKPWVQTPPTSGEVSEGGSPTVTLPSGGGSGVGLVVEK